MNEYVAGQPHTPYDIRVCCSMLHCVAVCCSQPHTPYELATYSYLCGVYVYVAHSYVRGVA